jgi:hypothetical protein
MQWSSSGDTFELGRSGMEMSRLNTARADHGLREHRAKRYRSRIDRSAVGSASASGLLVGLVAMKNLSPVGAEGRRTTAAPLLQRALVYFTLVGNEIAVLSACSASRAPMMVAMAWKVTLPRA